MYDKEEALAIQNWITNLICESFDINQKNESAITSSCITL